MVAEGEDWYETIEEPIRELVRRLRDSGINTTCSCGHKMYVQADILPDASLMVMHNTVFNWLGGQADYTIEVNLVVVRGVLMQTFATISIGG